MPMYEYRCRHCDAEFELIVFSSTTPACPSCQSEDLDKLLSGFSVGKSDASSHGCGGCAGADDCIGNRAAAARARGKASCC